MPPRPSARFKSFRSRRHEDDLTVFEADDLGPDDVTVSVNGVDQGTPEVDTRPDDAEPGVAVEVEAEPLEEDPGDGFISDDGEAAADPEPEPEPAPKPAPKPTRSRSTTSTRSKRTKAKAEESTTGDEGADTISDDVDDTAD